MQPRVSLVVAVARNGVIGNGNALPWRLPEDLRFFKALTMGKPILMGRKTYQSIGKPLPGRRNLVLTRDRGFSAPGVDVVFSLDEALAAVSDAAELMVIGGAEIYRMCLPRTQRIYLTRVHADVVGDTYFPQIDMRGWREVERREFAADDKNSFAMTFLTLEAVTA